MISFDAAGRDTADADPETVDAKATFELYEDDAGEWRWRLRHDNGNVVADSGEGYTSKANAKKGIRSVKRNAPAAPVEDTGSRDAASEPSAPDGPEELDE